MNLSINKKYVIFIWVLSFFFYVPPLHAETGLALMQKYKDIHEVDAEYTRSLMILKDRHGRVRERETVTYSKKLESGENRSLLKYISPKDIYNVGLITWEAKGGEDSQWLYLPASKRIKRIASGGKKNPFMGSDLSFEDMRVENLSTHDYQIVDEGELDGFNCWVIEITPSTKAEKKESGYGKRLLWLRKDVTYPMKIEYFNRRDKLTKVAIYNNVENIEGDKWRHRSLLMTTINKKTSTLIEIKKRELGLKIDSNTFNKQILRRPPNVR